MADQGLLRIARVAAFTVVCVLLAASGHAMAAGHHPPLAPLAVGGLAVAFTAGRLAGRERTLPEIGGAVTLAQGALHLLFAVAAPASPTETSASRPGHSGNMGHAGHQAPMATMASPELSGGADPFDMLIAHVTPSMLFAHLVAGLGAAWWLRQGEALVWRLCRLLGAPVSATLRALALLRRWLQWEGRLDRRWFPHPFGAALVVPCRAQILEHSLARRGPPAVFTR